MEDRKVDLLSARLGFEALVHRIRELESGVKDVSYNARKRISTLEAERDRLREAISAAFDKLEHSGSWTSEVHSAVDILDDAMSGEATDGE